MSAYNQTSDLLLAALTLLAVALYTLSFLRSGRARGVLCTRCRRRPSEWHVGDEWLCFRCAERAGQPRPRPGEHI